MFDLKQMQTLERDLAMRERAQELMKKCTKATFEAHEESRRILEDSYKLLCEMPLR